MTTRNAASMGNYGAAWQHKGYSGSGNVESILDSLKGRSAVVCGNAWGVFDEARMALGRLPLDTLVFAVNDVGMFLPKVDHWVTLHGANLEAWRAVRWLQQRPGRDSDVKIHSCDVHRIVDYAWKELTPVFALSGYFAMQIAYLMGAEEIVLCGCPGFERRRFFEVAPRDDFHYGEGQDSSDMNVRNQLIQEMNRLPEFKARVRSMSGWTKEYFGFLYEGNKRR